MTITTAYYLNTLIVAELKDGRARFVRGYTCWPNGTYSAELTDSEHEAQRFESQSADEEIRALHARMRDTHDEPVMFFRTISVLRPWKATYRVKPAARKAKTIGAFFARTYEAARKNALRIVDEETDGQGILESVEMTDDPRN